MVAASQKIDVKQLLLDDSTSFGPQSVKDIDSAINDDFAEFDKLKETKNELIARDEREELSPAGRVRLGVCLNRCGQYKEAIETLAKGDRGALSLFLLAQSHFAVGKSKTSLGEYKEAENEYKEALKFFEQSQKAGYNHDECVLGKAEVYFYQNKGKESLEELDKLSGPVEQTPDYLYLRGATVALLGENSEEAIRFYDRAKNVSTGTPHPGGVFGYALETERRGNDEEALELYKKIVPLFPSHVGVLINLGILYEDLEQYDQAVACYQRVLDSYPNNERARLFLKDARASSEMHFDEDAQRKRDRLGLVLNLPVSDFELSVRSRNCLKNMGIMTLGDLCRHTEQELLASKNFGETSLVEIRDMLTLKGLKLGQYASDKHTVEPVEVESLSPDEQAILLRPVTDLNLSVRARKCMNRLNIQTIGELVRRTADELLECKNFGVTSLKEIREKLTIYNIKLRGE